MNLLRILDSTPEPPIVDLHLESVNDSGEYNLATPMYEFQKELTDQIVSLHYSDILKYCETNDNTELIVKSLEICIENCLLVSSHPYLLITHYMPKNLLQRDMALKLAETSGKFNVLKDLINVISVQCKVLKRDTHVAVVMDNTNSKSFDLIESLLIGHLGNSIKIKRYIGNYLRRDHKKSELNNSNLTVHLIPPQADGIKEDLTIIPFDLLVIFDSKVNLETEFIHKLKTKSSNEKACVIKLIPMLTIEHCKLYYESRKQDPDYLYKLISSIVCLRDQIGILPPDIFPIYNQGLNYLSSFFHKLLSTKSSTGFPTWPLPELPSIPNFSSIDVEKSLLTEVHFHYTPYDADSNTEEEKPIKKSYYESNRLQLNYITNPLTNNYDKLIGIFNHVSTKINDNPNFLTHKLIMQINDVYSNYEIAKQEYQHYIRFNEPERQQEKLGRREHELKKVLANILSDVDHNTLRIESSNKKYLKKQEEIEAMRIELEKLNETITTFTSSIEDNSIVKVIENQIKIWELRANIKTTINKIKSKHEEKSYMKQELDNSTESIKQSQRQIFELKEYSTNLSKRLESFKENDVEENKKFVFERNTLIGKVVKEKENNEELKKKLTKTMKYLKDTSHLKKRKNRGITPK